MDKKASLGLSADRFGNIYLGDKLFCGYGVNSFSAATRYLEGEKVATFEEQFRLLKSYDIPFVRINLGGYWHWFYESYEKEPEVIIGKMHEVIKCAEKYEIGLVCSILWYDGAVATLVGEKRAAMGDPDSKTVAYMKKYVELIINEFKDSPAVWVWEVGNEYNLDADLCDRNLIKYIPLGAAKPKVPSGYDYYTSEEITTYCKLFAEVVRRVDGENDRLISNGNGDMRYASKAMHLAAKAHDENHLWDVDWTMDTEEDFCEMCAYFTPSPMDTLCFHVQHSEKDENGNDRYLDNWHRFGKTLSTKEYLEAYVKAAKKANKALYFGEFGDLMEMDAAPDAAEYFEKLVQTLIDAGITFASTWQFMTNRLVATDKGLDGDKLRSLQKANRAFIASGKQDIENYWKQFR